MAHRAWRWAAGAMAALVAVGGLAACGDDDDDDAGGGTSTTSAPTDDGGNALRIVGDEYSFQAPATLAGGVVDIEFVNEGDLVHEAFILGTGGRSQPEVLAAFKTVVTSEEGAPIPEFITAGGGAIETEAGETTETTITLAAGNYLIVCALTDEDSEDDEGGDEGADVEGEEGGGQQAEEAAEPPSPTHFELGMVVPLAVTPGDADTLPEADAEVTAREYTFDVEGLEAGDETINFVNDGPDQIHHAVVLEFPEGVDEAGAEAAFRSFGAAEGGGPPPEGTPEPTNEFGSSVFDPGRGGTFTGQFQAGRTYVFACFINDRAGGPPHAFANDMFKAVTVPE